MALVLNNRNPYQALLNLILKKQLRYDKESNKLFSLFLPEVLNVEDLGDGTVMMLSKNNQWKPSSDIIPQIIPQTMQISVPRNIPWLSGAPYFWDVEKRMKAIGRTRKRRSPKVGSCWGGCTCSYSHAELKETMRDLDVPGRSHLTTKAQMCRALEELGYFGLDITYPFAPLPYIDEYELLDLLPFILELDQETATEPNKEPEGVPIAKSSAGVKESPPNLVELQERMKNISARIQDPTTPAKQKEEFKETLFNLADTAQASRGIPNFTASPQGKKFKQQIKDKGVQDFQSMWDEYFPTAPTPQKIPAKAAAYGRRRRRTRRKY